MVFIAKRNINILVDGGIGVRVSAVVSKYRYRSVQVNFSIFVLLLNLWIV